MIKSERGASAVEFAIISPLLFILTFGIIEFGILLFDKAVVTNASREGARAAIVHGTTDGSDYAPLEPLDIINIVKDYADGHLIDLGSSGNDDPTIEVSYIDSSGLNNAESGGEVTVTVTFNYDFLVIPDLSQWFGGSFDGDIDLVGTTVMRME